MRRSRFPVLLLLSFFTLLGGRGLQAQLLAPGRGLQLIETASFSIYFPPELAGEARSLSSFAEEVLQSELGRFGPPLAHRLPILLTDQLPETNGFFTPSPSDRLVLMVKAPRLDDKVASLAAPLRGIFAHELAHALSLSNRPPLLRFAAWLFGDQIAGADLTSPSLTAEGLAIVAESSAREAGLGRAWDPLSAAIVRQNLAENRQPSFWEATGAGGGYPFGSAAYSYGGPFAAWLEEVYGQGSLARLFSAFSALHAPADSWLGRGAFSRTFGRDLPALWRDYLDTMALTKPLLTKTHRLVEKPGLIVALTAGEIGGRGTTIWADASVGAVLALSEGETRLRRLFAADGHLNRLDISPDGKLLLVSSAQDEGGFGRLVVKIWDLEAGGFLPESYPDLREAAWAPEGDPAKSVGTGDRGARLSFVALAPRGMTTDLVLVTEGRTRVLLEGGPELSFGDPIAIRGSDSDIIFLARRSGSSLLCKLDSGGRLWRLDSEIPLENLRFLAGRDGTLALGTASSRGLYRLLLVEGDGDHQRLKIQTRERTGSLGPLGLRSREGGGAGLPAISYVTSFADGDYPASYLGDSPRDGAGDVFDDRPGEEETLGIIEAGAIWQPLELVEEEAGKSGLGQAALLEPEPVPVKAPLLPLALRSSRSPVLSQNLDAAGLLLQGQDLSERLTWSLDGEYSWGAGAANLGAGIDLALSPWKLGLALEDRFKPLSGGTYYRQTRGSLRLALVHQGFPLRRHLETSLLLAAGALGWAPKDAPYSASYGASQAGSRFGLVYSDQKASYFPPFEEGGISVGAAVDAELGALGTSTLAFALETRLEAWLPLAGFHARAELALSPDSSLRLGPGGRLLRNWSPSLMDSGFTIWDEFGRLGVFGDWYASGELESRLAEFEIMRELSLFGFYARRLSLEAGTRGGLLGRLPDLRSQTGLQAPLRLASVFSRLSLEAAPLLGLLSQTGLIAGLEVEYALTPYSLATPWGLALLLGARL